jgi:hypothetical protein
MSRHVRAAAVLLLALTVTCACSSPVTAQTTLAATPAAQAVDSPPAFASARTPTSPAFTIFGLEPSSVERPANPSDFAVAFLTKAEDVTAVPKDFAVESSPYWLVRHPNLKWSDDIRRNVVTSLARTATFSVATGELGTVAAPVRGLAVGGRASLLSGTLSRETQNEIARLEKLLTAESALGLRLMKDQLAVLTKMLLTGKITPEEHAEMMQELQKATIESKEYLESAERKAVETLMEKFATVRNGLFVEVAGAAGWRYANASWAQGDFDRWGLWVTPSFIGNNQSVIGVFRYLSEDADAGTDQGVLDFGARGVHYRDRYALSLEYVRRTFRAENLNGGHRVVGIAEYAVSDALWLTATFGRGHNVEGHRSLLASLGLSFNFREERLMKPGDPK